MNTEKKQAQQANIHKSIKGIETAILKAVAMRENHFADIEKLMRESQTYTKEYIDLERQKKKDNFSAEMSGVHKDVEKRLEELRTLIHERDDVLDLANPAFIGAVTLIQAVKPENITHEQAQQINANFANDQKALSAIYAAYGNRDLGNIGKMMYNADSAVNGMVELARTCFTGDGSVNQFAGKFSQLAQLEGATVEATPDQRGVMDAARKGAGLPV